MSNGQVGAAISYRRAVGAQQMFHMTDAFVIAHPVVSEMILLCSGQAGNRWRMLSSADEVTNVANKFADKGRLAELLVFVSNRDFKHTPVAPEHS